MHTEKDNIGNFLLAEVELQKEISVLCVIYGPNTDNPGFYIDLKNKLLPLNDTPLIICGDWNLVLDYSVHTYGQSKK